MSPCPDCRHLDGKLPAGAHSQSLAEAQSRAFAAMQAGQPFVQYYRSGPSGALVKKNVRLVYVPEENKAEGLGKLYWGEVRRRAAADAAACTRSWDRCVGATTSTRLSLMFGTCHTMCLHV